MKRFVTPTLQISIGLLSLTISLIFIAYSFGLIPNEGRAALEARARISEHLAVQLANLASRNDAEAIQETMESIVSRNSDILSIAIRKADGQLIAHSGDHDVYWREPADEKSTATHMLVPLRDGDALHGRIEIVFQPFDTSKDIFGFPQAMMIFVGFIGFAGLAGYYFILKRSLRELDPSRAIPERVKAAFDTLAEGVLILDEQEFVLLANDAFIKNIYATDEPLLGTDVNKFPWAPADEESELTAEPPWRTAVRDEKPVLGIPMSICDRFGNRHQLLVNATRIVDGSGVVRGVIATFDDVTVLHQTNEQLNSSIDQLHASQFTISEQNKQLLLLASSDPLTGCLNRRTFFSEAEQKFREARSQNRPMSFLMLDADHFKSVNDRFGHVVGDQVLIGLVDIMKRICGERGLVGRYGGEEFCIAVAGLREQDVERLAEQIRRAVASVTTLLPNGEPVTVSIGIASVTEAPCEIADLVKRADEALYAAKTTGRNRFVSWSRMPPQPLVPQPLPSAQSAQKGENPLAPPVPVGSEANPKRNDELTGCPNREALVELIDAMIREDNGTRGFAIARIDVDNLEYFNDRYGRDVSDALLVKISQRIKSRLRRSDILGRIGADEFLLLFEPFDSKEQIEPIVERILGELERPFPIGEFELFGSCRIGVSVYPEHGRSYEVLRRNADNAMFRPKQSARGETVFFDARMTQAMAARMEAEQRLRLAIRDRKFCCAFQPKVDINRRQVVGFEALVRLRDEDGEIHLPEKFIGLAVELGLIDQITNLVLEMALKSIDRLDAAFGSATTVSVNVAAVLANDLEFMLRFVNAIRDSGFSNRIILELTEESFIAKGIFQTVIVPILREIGVRVSIDDFGTGYSSLSVLADITADEIKVDRSFISGIHQRPRNQSILRAINSLGHALNMTIVAEGVETFEEVAYLKGATSIRCAQGFYFSEPFYLDDMSRATRVLSNGDSVESRRSSPAPLRMGRE
jgi:diguanylate cyclase (GGDEF)-like protein/PAS domain S-box-containing protein